MAYSDVLVQHAKALALDYWGRWQGMKRPLPREIMAGIEGFHDKELQTLRRYLPHVGNDKWPILYDLRDFSVLQEVAEADRGGQIDVGGILGYGGPDLILSVCLMLSDYCRPALDRAWPHSPDALSLLIWCDVFVRAVHRIDPTTISMRLDGPAGSEARLLAEATLLLAWVRTGLDAEGTLCRTVLFDKKFEGLRDLGVFDCGRNCPCLAIDDLSQQVAQDLA